MRISDWSSDVCSADLLSARAPLDAKAFARLNADFFYELSAMTGNGPLQEISERLYFQTFRIWLQSVPRLTLADEAAIFQREIADILDALRIGDLERSEEHTSELQSLMRISYAVFCLTKKNTTNTTHTTSHPLYSH